MTTTIIPITTPIAVPLLLLEEPPEPAAAVEEVGEGVEMEEGVGLLVLPPEAEVGLAVGLGVIAAAVGLAVGLPGFTEG